MSGFSKNKNVLRGDVTITGTFSVKGSFVLNSDSAVKQGSQLWDIISDKTTKKNIRELTVVETKELVEAVNESVIKKFQYKEDHSEEYRIGVIADEMHPVFVKTTDTNIKHIKADELLFSVLLAYQELKKEVYELKQYVSKKEEQ